MLTEKNVLINIVNVQVIKSQEANFFYNIKFSKYLKDVTELFYIRLMQKFPAPALHNIMKILEVSLMFICLYYLQKQTNIEIKLLSFSLFNMGKIIYGQNNYG